jgi:phosphatidylinositol 3-kinase
MNIYNEIFNEFVQKIKNFDEINKNIQNQEEFHTNLLKISSELTKYKYADDKKRYLKEILKEKDKGLGKEMSNNFYLPLYPQVIVNGVVLDKCTVFPSAMCPVKYDFNITPETSKYLKKDENDNDDHSFYSVIFKNGDDIRQDQLILQIISFMDLLLKEDKNNFEFTTYKVMATSKQSGFVEFVNNSETISYILKNYNNIIESYIKKYSNNDEKTFDEHLNNYINSLAGYSIVTYILGIGDRHLENLMIDQKGKLFHIDFGYILGKDPKFYTTPIRLDLQMFKCIGNKIEEFKNLCVKCFLTLRENARLIVNLLYLMKDSGIPELNNLENLNKLYNKFFPGYTKQQATDAILNVLNDSYNSYSYAFNDKLHSMANYSK